MTNFDKSKSFKGNFTALSNLSLLNRPKLNLLRWITKILGSRQKVICFEKLVFLHLGQVIESSSIFSSLVKCSINLWKQQKFHISYNKLYYLYIFISKFIKCYIKIFILINLYFYLSKSHSKTIFNPRVNERDKSKKLSKDREMCRQLLFWHFNSLNNCPSK